MPLSAMAGIKMVMSTFGGFQFVLSIVNIQWRFLTGWNWAMNLLMIEKSMGKDVWSRCNRLYLESLFAFPGKAMAIPARLMVVTFNPAMRKFVLYIWRLLDV